MKKSLVVRSISAAACGLLAVTAGGAANASDYEPAHESVVSDDAVDWTPDLVAAVGAKPLAYSIAEAGDQMVVGGRFSVVESNFAGQAQFERSNVFAFDATDGKVSTTFTPQVDGQVWSVLSDGTSVYIGGNFTSVNGVPRAALAKLSLATGALDTNFNPTFTGGRVSDMEILPNGQLAVSGTFVKKLSSLNTTTGKPTSYISNVVAGKLPSSDSTQVFKFDVSSDGQHLVGVGNFLTVDAQSRPRVFMLDLGATSSTLSPWNYEPLGEPCTSGRTNAQAYVQDVDFAPDSSYFALAAFGYMYQGYDEPIGSQSNRRWYQICDSVSRFETTELNPSQPTWINYTGGDSLKSVAVTEKAVYVQGHSRWLDSPYGRDSKDEFGVDRLGGGAVSPEPVADADLLQYARVGDLKAVPGKALDWNPVMPQQSGGYQILPTAAGVWFATDGTRFGGEYHAGIRFAPLP